jgi:predicted phage baseplate assembly protein
MRRLAPDGIARRFEDLMEMGRARLPGLAPEWTDHNAHDPGITLMELLAWITEAQLYALGHTRRDQRAAFAALLGIATAGTQPARGLLWPDRLDPSAPGAIHTQSRVIAADTVVNRIGAESPTFRPTNKLLWVPGRIRRLAAHLADGRVLDYTALNEHGGAAFQPFGELAGARDVLVMDFQCVSDHGLFPQQRADAKDALWPIGVQADRPSVDVLEPESRLSAASASPHAPSLTVTLVTSDTRIPLRIVSDSSNGLLRTGVLLLDVSGVPVSPRELAIELRARRGFERAPRVLRIEPNVVPIEQGKRISDEMHVATGLPDWSFRLDARGLRFAPFEAPVKIEVRDAATNVRYEWRNATLTDSGPNDSVYELDASTQRVTFGNGVNGRIPPQGASVLASYAVSDGEEGNVAANRKWHVAGFLGSFGVNIEPVSGGAAATSGIDERREARRRVRDDHALVSAEDIESAARAVPLLEVARAWVLAPSDDSPRTGVITLVAMRARASEAGAGSVPETRRWLEAIRKRLSPRMPLATRLAVIAPRYVDFSIRATIDAAAGRDPQTIRIAIEHELAKRLALVGPQARNPGIPVTSRDVTGWIRRIDGVRRVAGLQLILSSGEEDDEVRVPRSGLPRLDLASSTIDVRRNGSRSAP